MSLSRTNATNLAVAATVGLSLLAVSPMLMPQPHELAIMHYRDKEFEQAQSMFLSEYKGGDQEIGVMYPLAHLYLQSGDVDAAIRVMETMERARPNDPDVLRELGRYYQYAQRPTDFLRTLEKRRSLGLSADVLHDLANIYSFLGRYDDQVGALMDLIRHGWATGAEEAGAAYLLASKGRAAEAMRIVTEDLKSRKRDADHGEEAERLRELGLSLQIDFGSREECLDFIRHWLRTEPDEDTLRQILNLLDVRGRFDLILATLDGEAASRPLSPEMLERRAIALVNLDRYDDAYQMFMRVISPGKLTTWGRQAFIEAAAHTRHFTDIIGLMRGGAPEAGVTLALQEAVDAHATADLPGLLAFLNQPGRERNPVLMVRIALLLNDAGEISRWLDAAGKAPLAPDQELWLIETLAAAHRPEAADKLVRLAEQSGLPATLLPRIAGLFATLGEAGRGRAALAGVAERSPDNPYAHLALAIVAAADGRPIPLGDWLASEAGRAAPPDLLLAGYGIADDAKLRPLAADLAEALYRRDQSPPALARLIEAALAAADPERLSRIKAGLKDRLPAAGDPAVVARLANLLVDAGGGDLALRVLAPLDVRLDADTGLLVAWARAQLQVGNPRLAFSRLQPAADRFPKDGTLAQMTAEATLGSGQWRTLLARPAGWLRGLPDYLQTGALRAALDDGGPAETGSLVAAFGTGVLERNPLRWAEVKLQSGDRTGALERLNAEATRTDAPPADRLRLALLWLKLGEKAPAERAFERLMMAPDLPDEMLPGLASLCLGLGRADEGLRRFGPRLKPGGSWPATTAWAILTAAAHRGDAVVDWLGTAPLGPEDRPFLRDLYYAAAGAGAGGARAGYAAATRLWSLGQVPEDRLILARASLDAGKIPEALTLTADIGEATPETASLRLAALVAGVKAGLVPNEAVVSRLTARMATADAAGRRQLLYDLAALKAWDTVLPYLAAKAEGDPELAALYFSTLAAAGRKDELARVMETRALNAATPEAERRSLAANLLAAGRKAPAEQVFTDLAARHGPAGKDMADLRYLWGPRARPAALDWLETRARASSGETRAGWLRVLAEVGGARRAAGLLGALHRDDGPALRVAAVHIYHQLGDRAGLRGALDAAAADDLDPATLRTFIGIARDQSFPDLADRFGRKLLARAPDDAATLRLLGQLAFAREDYREAERLLGRTLATSPAGDFESRFQLGEIAAHAGDRNAASRYWLQALDAIQRSGNNDFYSRHLRGVIFQRLKRFDDALAVFETLRREFPERASLRTDIAETFILKGTPERAQEILLSGRER